MKPLLRSAPIVGSSSTFRLMRPTGRCKVILMIGSADERRPPTQEPAECKTEVDGTPLYRKGSVLVYGGTADNTIDDPIAAMRDQRIRCFIRQAIGQ
ncbi:MAG: hypothetical protein KY476_17130 [Planctomycetes bacterium]|nr:hypothetical protein [Planctomycetota bacterium]